MKDSSLLQLMFAFFLGLVLVAFVGVAVNTVYPQPDYPDYPMSDSAQAAWQATHDRWSLTTCIVLLICATAILAVSLFLPEHQAVISNGILMGGVFTMIYAVVSTFNATTSWARLIVITVALAVTVGIGYLKFVRRAAGAPAAGTGASYENVSDLDVRLTAVEQKIDAIGKALRG